MSELPGRTLLSQWIKAPMNTNRTYVENENDFCRSKDPVKVNREHSTRKWDEIFRKPAAEVPEAKATEPLPIVDVVPPRRKRKFNPKNPFNSYVVTMNFPSHLNDQLIQRQEAAKVEPTINEPCPPVPGGILKPAGFQRPTFMHKFKVPKHFLQNLTQKKHPFFAKRITSNPAIKNPLHSFSKPLRKREAPWDVVHIRPKRSWNRPANRLDYRPQTNTTKHSHCQSLYSIELPSIYIPEPLITPKRLLASKAQTLAMAELSQSPAFAANNKRLLETIQEVKPYDQGQFENRLWCEKYSPKSWKTHVSPDIARQVSDWLSKQFQLRPKMLERKATRPKRRYNDYSQDDNFVVDDDEVMHGEMPDDILLLCGSPGSGKSSAVHAAASSQEAFVYEISSAVKRTGKEIATMLDGISQNYAVHKAKHVVILIDDGDIVFENEAGSFWSTISRFAATSRHPVVLTCSEPQLVALSGVSTDTLWLPEPDFVRVTDLAWLIALSEGHIVDRLRLAQMVLAWRGDLRRVICQLQFWCQMGIGGSPSSEEWVPKEFEMVSHKADRIISQGTWFPDVLGDVEREDPIQHEIEKLEKSLNDSAASDSASSSTLGLHLELADLKSIKNIEPLQNCEVQDRAAINDSMLFTNGALPVKHWTEPLILPEKYGSAALHDVFAMESSYGTSTQDIATDVAPYMRMMVAADYQRHATMQKHMTSHSEREARMIRRAWANNGIDTRQYLELSPPSMSVVLRTGFPPELLQFLA